VSQRRTSAFSEGIADGEDGYLWVIRGEQFLEHRLARAVDLKDMRNYWTGFELGERRARGRR